MNEQSTYQEIQPKTELKDFVHSFWMHQNNSDSVEKITIVPDSYFKIVMLIKNQKIIAYFITGLWLDEKEFSFAPNTFSVGVRLKILAPEFLLNREVASILQKTYQLDLGYLNIDKFDLSSFEIIVEQWQKELLSIKPKKEIQGNKLRLSQLLDKMDGNISAIEVSNQIYWTNRQINRYLNRYLGVSLKKYLNIQKCYQSYIQIRNGEFYPENGFFDQPHFIREIKKHTGETPKSLHEQQNDRFIQLKRISKK
ncbi:AraC family transcriptional regulator [Flavobacteriaceae bacterium S0825]|uniref:helix-turn-helix domain-containing protein n=1 Tax=Gaetbulibacter sp. S0825 TaxID=2720084 RepID=UPI0014311E7D|nr:AraC family transcriptional regulator [Gaetbulibacter sp. S0825]MCK0110508.1 AraC family transcriptional regulator [Flavobacteriaceae bacterium S0825]NIX66137.1 helix-turn-helix transcriptional regulator [Gaetbulibacter sp. S0825]